MKLRNKKTGGLANIDELCVYTDAGWHNYNSLAKLNEEWEDYKEPKDIWWLDNEGCVNHASGDVNDSFRKNRKIGNYFLSREEAEKAVEKLKAWKRLKDNGVKFEGWKRDERYCGDYIIKMTDQSTCDDKDLDLLFGR